METRSLNYYIKYGTGFRYLLDVQKGYRIHGEGHVIYNIEWFLESSDELGFVVTRRASGALEKFLNELLLLPEDARLVDGQVAELKKIIRELRPTMWAETTGFEAYIATDKRYSVEKLTTNVWALFRKDVRSSIPDIARHDFEEAGKCIAFERATAAAFHLMRGTESVLRNYYCEKVKRNRIKDLMWGPIVKALRAKREPPPAALLDHLDNIRKNFRNPTQHPEKIYDIQEVQDLLNLSIDVVNRMVADAQKPERLSPP